jgi:hypothetical protein
MEAGGWTNFYGGNGFELYKPTIARVVPEEIDSALKQLPPSLKSEQTRDAQHAVLLWRDKSRL